MSAWQPWIQLVNDSVEESADDWGFADALSALPSRFRRVVAAAYSVAKWHPENPIRGDGSCGWCSYYQGSCAFCSVTKRDLSCYHSDSLFRRYITFKYAEIDTRKYRELLKLYNNELPVDSMYKLLLNIYNDEYSAFMGTG